MMRAIIVDDERLARKELYSLLKEHQDIHVIAEAGSVTEAAELILDKEPDVVFLDIQMPGETGFELLDKIDVDFKIIFVTAYDEYAIRAFDVNALDYLLKPVNPVRLRRSIDRLINNQTRREIDLKQLEYDDRLFLKMNNSLKFLKINSIASINAEGDYSNVLTKDGKSSVVSKSLKEWETRLPEKYFVRIHRSTIINLELVERVEKWFNYSYRIYLQNIEEPLIMSRRYATRLKGKLKW